MYSQYDEEKHILEAVAHITRGRVLDIGAWAAKDFSNSRALIERGWQAVLVEPSPEPFLGLLREYGKQSNVTLINAAIGFDRHFELMQATADAVSTTDPVIYEKWKDAANFTGQFYTPVFRLEDLFLQFGGNFDLVSIDTEGSSVDVFHEFMATENRPTCVIVEHDDRDEEVRQAGERNGYRVTYYNGTNMVLAR